MPPFLHLAILPTHMYMVLSTVMGTWIPVQFSFDKVCASPVYVLKAGIIICAYKLIFSNR